MTQMLLDIYFTNFASLSQYNVEIETETCAVIAKTISNPEEEGSRMVKSMTTTSLGSEANK